MRAGKLSRDILYNMGITDGAVRTTHVGAFVRLEDLREDDMLSCVRVSPAGGALYLFVAVVWCCVQNRHGDRDRVVSFRLCV